MASPTQSDFLEVANTAATSEAFQNLSPPIQVALFLGGLALLTTVLVGVTSFTRIVIVLSFVRRAMTTQEIPPNPTVIGLALFLTVFTMGPTFDEITTKAIKPYLENKDFGATQAIEAASIEMHHFMIRHTRKRDLALFIQMGGGDPPQSASDTPMRVLIPAFMVSELKTAFIMGFCIYIPFILIDLLVSTVLMSLGMMMMPPVVISAPFKLLLFVLVDGWSLVAAALGRSFAQ